MQELEDCVFSTTDDDVLEAILRTDIAYRKHTSPQFVKTRPPTVQTKSSHHIPDQS